MINRRVGASQTQGRPIQAPGLLAPAPPGDGLAWRPRSARFRPLRSTVHRVRIVFGVPGDDGGCGFAASPLS